MPTPATVSVRQGPAWAALALLAACASPAPPPRATPADAPAPPLLGAASVPLPEEAAPLPPVPPGPPRGTELRTRHASFRVALPEDLPGWHQDDLREVGDAFRQSCRVLEKRVHWRDPCQSGPPVTAPLTHQRHWFESRFVFLRVHNPDRSAEGTVTGYFEPLLAGSLQREGRFTVPVRAAPEDLLLFDWSSVPEARRKGVVALRADGRQLRLAAPGETGTLSLDLRAFTLDERDRRLRLRREGARLLPYWSRDQIEAGAGRGAVLAWVADPLGLYAMQMQGAGRIRLPDGSTLRLAYAEQNGQPFQPRRVVADAREAPVRTRGAAAAEEVDLSFRFAPEPSAADEDADDTDTPVTRGVRITPAGPPARSASPASPGATDARVDEMVGRLSGGGGGGGGAAPAGSAARAGAGTAAGPATRPAGRGTSGRPAPAATAAAGGVTGSGVRIPDPSYVFFRSAPDQSPAAGPVGALGVPLTAGRSVAVDPRVTPLGYPVWLATRAGRQDPAPPMRKLVFAQDTGGAIRGAVRADHFWGFGAEAARRAGHTRQRGEMWLMMPRAEFRALTAGKLRTRGAGTEEVTDLARDCLLEDDEACAGGGGRP